MPIAERMIRRVQEFAVIKNMFEEGRQLKAKHGEHNVYDSSLGNPDVPPPPAFRKALREMAQSEALSFGYAPMAGHRQVPAVARRAGDVHPGVGEAAGEAAGLRVHHRDAVAGGVAVDGVLVELPLQLGGVAAAGRDGAGVEVDAVVGRRRREFRPAASVQPQARFHFAVSEHDVIDHQLQVPDVVFFDKQQLLLQA